MPDYWHYYVVLESVLEFLSIIDALIPFFSPHTHNFQLVPKQVIL